MPLSPLSGQENRAACVGSFLDFFDDNEKDRHAFDLVVVNHRNTDVNPRRLGARIELHLVEHLRLGPDGTGEFVFVTLKPIRGLEEISSTNRSEAIPFAMAPVA